MLLEPEIRRDFRDFVAIVALMNILEILKSTPIEVAPETFSLVSLSLDNWLKLRKNPALPQTFAPFMMLRDRWEVTLLLDEVDFAAIRSHIGDAKTAGGFRLLSFDAELDFSVVGFLAEVARILAESKISIIALSAFSRDHILIQQKDLPKALESLQGYVARSQSR